MFRKVKAALEWPLVAFRPKVVFLPRITNINYRGQNKATAFATAASQKAAHQQGPVFGNRQGNAWQGLVGRDKKSVSSNGIYEITSHMKSHIWLWVFSSNACRGSEECACACAGRGNNEYPNSVFI